MMKRLIIGLVMVMTGICAVMAETHEVKTEGSCGRGCRWNWDGYTLTIHSDSYEKDAEMDNYNTKKNQAPWKKKGFAVRRVKIDKRVSSIGDCAFYDLPNLEEVEFTGTGLRSIGWGAFMDCRCLSKLTLPSGLREIGKIAFANCDGLKSITIPDNCRVEEQAFASCDNLKSISISPTSILGRNVFAGEAKIDGKTRHTLFTGTVLEMPSYITKDNAPEYGIAKSAIADAPEIPLSHKEYTHASSAVDTRIPDAVYLRNNTYALVIGNENYQYASDVPGAVHDAKIVKEYFRKTLGIPEQNIHLVENATGDMIMKDELAGWLDSIPGRDRKSLIVFYSGNGIADTQNDNKSYLLPTDVHGTTPDRGIALDDFYSRLGELGFNQTTVLIDASFSGLNRYNEGVADGTPASGVEAEKVNPTSGNVIAITAAQGKEAALGLPDEGHGLFTYCLLNVIRDTSGVMSLGTLYDRLCANMPKAAATLKKGKTQTPSLRISDSLATKWRTIRL